MMKTLSISAVLALAIAGAAHATPQEATTEDSGFNLMMPVDDTEASDDGWNLGIIEDDSVDGFAIPEGTVQDRLGDVAEIPTGEAEASASALPNASEAEDDLIRLE